MENRYTVLKLVTWFRGNLSPSLSFPLSTMVEFPSMWSKIHEVMMSAKKNEAQLVEELSCRSTFRGSSPYTVELLIFPHLPVKRTPHLARCLLHASKRVLLGCANNHKNSKKKNTKQSQLWVPTGWAWSLNLGEVSIPLVTSQRAHFHNCVVKRALSQPNKQTKNFWLLCGLVYWQKNARRL